MLTKSHGHPPAQQVQQQHPPYLRPPPQEPHHLIAMLAQASKPESYEPKTYREAISIAYAKTEWKLAIGDEYISLIKNKIWERIDLPPGRKALRGKQVFKLKRGHNGELLRYKARWVVRGFEQRLDLDYNENFASVVKPMSYKALLAVATSLDWEFEQMYDKTAFLNEGIEEDIFVEQPTDQDDGSGRLCRLYIVLYGLKQSPRVWYKTLAAFLGTCSSLALL